LIARLRFAGRLGAALTFGLLITGNFFARFFEALLLQRALRLLSDFF